MIATNYLLQQIVNVMNYKQHKSLHAIHFTKLLLANKLRNCCCKVMNLIEDIGALDVS